MFCLIQQRDDKKAGVITSMYAVVETGGKQYKVQEGDIIHVEKLKANEGDLVDFKVIAYGEEAEIHVGNPYIDSARVSGTVVKTAKGKKITVFTYKPKKSCKRKMGHRQWYTRVEIGSIIIV